MCANKSIIYYIRCNRGRRTIGDTISSRSRLKHIWSNCQGCNQNEPLGFHNSANTFPYFILRLSAMDHFNARNTPTPSSMDQSQRCDAPGTTGLHDITIDEVMRPGASSDGTISVYTLSEYIVAARYSRSISIILMAHGRQE